MSIEDNKKVAVADVLNIGPKTLEEKLAGYTGDAVVWDPVMKVAGYAETNTASGFKEVKKFFTWLANLPPVKAKVQSVFGEGDWVAVEWLLQGGGGEQTFEIPCVNVYEFKDSKIKGVRMHFDSAYFAEIING
jgi:predicted SnoaL-like aldol condensation-catalyzing enzyme